MNAHPTHRLWHSPRAVAPVVVSTAVLHEPGPETGANVLVSERSRYPIDTEIKGDTFEHLLQCLSSEAGLHIILLVLGQLAPSGLVWPVVVVSVVRTSTFAVDSSAGFITPVGLQCVVHRREQVFYGSPSIQRHTQRFRSIRDRIQRCFAGMNSVWTVFSVFITHCAVSFSISSVNEVTVVTS